MITCDPEPARPHESGIPNLSIALGSVVLKEWLVNPGDRVENGQIVCRINADGRDRSVEFYDSHDSVGWIAWHEVAEGQELDPWGSLFQWSWGGPLEPVAARQVGARPRQGKYERRSRYPRVFLSYRREDGEAQAGQLYETLGHELGFEDVFMDQFSIDASEHYIWTIQQATAHARVMVALIGPRWLNASDDQGNRRLDRSHDLVRREITAALDREIDLVAVRLQHAEIPKYWLLPEGMGELVHRQMADLSVVSWSHDAQGLANRIKALLRREDPQ